MPIEYERNSESACIEITDNDIDLNLCASNATDERALDAIKKRLTIIVVDHRMLHRECLVYSLGAVTHYRVLAYANVRDWLHENSSELSDYLLILSTRSKELLSASVSAVLEQSPQRSQAPLIVVMSDANSQDHVLALAEVGVRGFITNDVPLRVLVEIIHLVEAGGIYLPPTCLLSPKLGEDPTTHAAENCRKLFSARQTEVLQAIRQGKANKVIAHELKMSESTVKIHVRSIMKKLSARNRTEVAFKTNAMFHDESLTK